MGIKNKFALYCSKKYDYETKGNNRYLVGKDCNVLKCICVKGKCLVDNCNRTKKMDISFFSADLVTPTSAESLSPEDKIILKELHGI